MAGFYEHGDEHFRKQGNIVIGGIMRSLLAIHSVAASSRNLTATASELTRLCESWDTLNTFSDSPNGLIPHLDRE